jgi:hypothetical protein
LNFSVTLFNKDKIISEVKKEWIEINKLINNQPIYSELHLPFGYKSLINFEYLFMKEKSEPENNLYYDLLIQPINSPLNNTKENIYRCLDSPLQSEFILNSYLNSNTEDFSLKLIPTKITSDDFNRESNLQINHLKKDSSSRLTYSNNQHDLDYIADSIDSMTNSSPHEVLKEDKPKLSFLYEKSLNPQMICEIIPYEENSLINSEIEKKRGENFCEAFFISGIPLYDPEITEYSNDLNSECGHRNCNFLPAYQPDILFRYPEKDFSNFELTSTVKIKY